MTTTAASRGQRLKQATDCRHIINTAIVKTHTGDSKLKLGEIIKYIMKDEEFVFEITAVTGCPAKTGARRSVLRKILNSGVRKGIFVLCNRLPRRSARTWFTIFRGGRGEPSTSGY